MQCRWFRAASLAGGGVLVILAQSDFCRAEAASGRFRSPLGKYELAFEAPNTLVSPDPDKAPAMQGLKTIRYRLSFYKPGSGTDVATTDFYDIRASPSKALPTPVEDFVKQMLWSPGEDFVVLPREPWPTPQAAASVSPPGRVGPTAISLNTDFPWINKSFPFDKDPLIWLNSRQVVGNLRDGCQVSVAEFDAHTGKTSPIGQSPLPAGYVIVSGDANQILMKKILGPCAAPEDTKTFIPECTYYDLKFERRHIGACPG